MLGAVGQHSINSHRSQDQSEEAERGRNHSRHAQAKGDGGDARLERRRVENRKIGIQLVDALGSGGRDIHGIFRYPDVQGQFRRGELLERKINERAWRLIQVVVLGGPGHADCRGPFAFYAQAPAHGLLARPVAVHQRLVDDHHRRGVRRIVL